MSKTVVNKRDQFKWDNGFEPNGQTIPETSSSDAGKVLGVDSNGKYVLKEDAGSVLPEITPSDEGKVLKVENGTTVWGADEGTEYTAGNNIQISSENVISATNTTYSAGNNVQISSENVISATDTTYTAGDNIQISSDNEISATDTTYTAGDNVAISADNEISSVNTLVFDVKYIRVTDTFQYDADAIAPFLTEVYKNDKRAIVRVQEGNYNNYDIYTLTSYQSGNKAASFTKTHPSIVSANQREIVCSNIALYISNGVGTLRYTNEGVVDLPEGAIAGQIPISDGHNGWIAGDIPTELPSVSSSDEGKVLKVDSNGKWSVGTDNDTTYTAGTNVQINGNVISATDTTYSAGTGITITGTSISADSQLPSYSSSENGKVLSVDSNGDLEWVTASGGDDVVFFNFDETTSGSGVYELKNGKTSDDVVSAIASGKAVYLIQGDMSTTGQVYTLRLYIPNTSIAFTNTGHNTSASTITVQQASIMLILGTTTLVTLESQTLGGGSYTQTELAKKTNEGLTGGANFINLKTLKQSEWQAYDEIAIVVQPKVNEAPGTASSNRSMTNGGALWGSKVKPEGSSTTWYRTPRVLVGKKVLTPIQTFAFSTVPICYATNALGTSWGSTTNVVDGFISASFYDPITGYSETDPNQTLSLFAYEKGTSNPIGPAEIIVYGIKY